MAFLAIVDPSYCPSLEAEWLSLGSPLSLPPAMKTKNPLLRLLLVPHSCRPKPGKGLLLLLPNPTTHEQPMIFLFPSQEKQYRFVTLYANPSVRMVEPKSRPFSLST
mmetsp:Transcript_79037/g.228498  ORF Transcript_79037/g.228498 Transcript_79037/m.228498 type:complete len:107 (+) Transcript_79037:206-526(+)